MRYNLVFPASRKYNADFCVSRSSYKKTVTRPGDSLRHKITVTVYGVTHQKKPVCCRRPDRSETGTIVPFCHPQSCRYAVLRQLPSMGGWRFCAFGTKVPQSAVSPIIPQQTLYLGGKVMLDHKKEAITELWQFCPKCNIKLYRMTADCTGFIHIKCWRCREMLWLNLSIRAK